MRAALCAVTLLTATLPAGITETREEIVPGLTHVHRFDPDAPLNVNVLVVDLTEPAISVRTELGQGTVNGVETVRSMAQRTGAVAAVNGDYWTFGGVPLGLTVVDGEIVTAPKFRTALGITRERRAVIGMWADDWNWDATVIAAGGASREIMMINSDCNPGWLTLYSHHWGRPSRGASVSPETEAVIDADGTVTEVRTDLPGVEIPEGGFVLTGRGDSGAWLAAHVREGDRPVLDLRTDPDWRELWCAVGGGPRILRNGAYHEDPMAEFPAGEEFTLDWKDTHYNHRQPRTAAGTNDDGTRLVLVVVDGRQDQFSRGVLREEMAALLAEFGATQGTDLDSGGSSTMVIRGEVVNHVSDQANADGTGGVERPVCNGLMIHSTASAP